MPNQINTEDQSTYVVVPTGHNEDKELDDMVIAEAIEILEKRVFKEEFKLTTPDDVRNYVKLKMRQLEHEVFSAIFLDNKHYPISFNEVFRGTLSSASVYPREVVKEALKANAAAVILVHNHPSGSPEPSQADQHITRRLVSALELVDIRVLDHLVVGDSVTSFAERGLL